MRERKTLKMILRVSPGHKQAFEEAATKAGLSLSEWARAVLLRAAHEGAFAPQAERRVDGKKRHKQ